MKHLMATLLLLAGTTTVLADDFVDLRGQWLARADVLAIDLGGTERPVRFSAELVMEIDWQDGAHFTGRELEVAITSGGETHPMVEDERIAGVFTGEDGKIAMIDENGMRDCVVVSSDELTCVYRHMDDGRTVVTRGTWIRQR